MSAVYAATSNYEEVHGPRLAQVAVGKEASFAMLSVTADSQLGMRDIEGFGDNPPPFSGKKQSRQAAIESFKTVIKRWKCSSSQLVASVGEGEGLSYL